jgi:hypothetical protein
VAVGALKAGPSIPALRTRLKNGTEHFEKFKTQAGNIKLYTENGTAGFNKCVFRLGLNNLLGTNALAYFENS